ncbi:citrate synthase [Faecalibacter rhinopitheci]|uniref:Citrate synthase n=1 Tax=Faecalibacter rhinopitheci TaxID=2779678 RepID=A0A8J7K513_9FLAO|nr:citrate synthase [Faecalibacter rhinopitheci]MBF0598073.1 citrate synthase [Faecalibacter rhinopitheci]MBQ0148291.1 citrate synthase [Candidatus Onthonaster equi]
MSDKVVLSYDGKELELPVSTGSMDEKSIDVSKLRGATGLITMDPGYKNTGSCESKITFLDGEEGKLLYRGYPIEQIADQSNFEEVMYLLIKGELPTQEQLDGFVADIRKNTEVAEEIVTMLNAFPQGSHPMAIISSLTSALSVFNADKINVATEEEMYEAAVTLLGQFPVIAAWSQRKIKGLPLTKSDNSLSYVENFYQMLFNDGSEGYKADPTIVDAFDKLLILHADHEQNCSASTVRLVGSSHAGIFASIAAGISALWGPLHGGANQAVLEMLEAIQNDGGDVAKYIGKAKDKEDPFRLMGFGHRVYKNFDPRARIIKVAADNVLSTLGIEDPILDIARGLEQACLEDDYFKARKLYPNVDFYSGIIYKALQIPTEMFTVMFAVGRLPGWIAQWMEMRQTNQPIGRPRQLYTGAATRDYVEMSAR